ncbi:hypothetical protein [Kibdelosporangium philippinense]|uniref:hypothetical protein n=1 Tax=Kibdelosporangium philippinense TaxID=211113 RepID=UPI0036088BD4
MWPAAGEGGLGQADHLTIAAAAPRPRSPTQSDGSMPARIERVRNADAQAVTGRHSLAALDLDGEGVGVTTVAAPETVEPSGAGRAVMTMRSPTRSTPPGESSPSEGSRPRFPRVAYARRHGAAGQ